MRLRSFMMASAGLAGLVAAPDQGFAQCVCISGGGAWKTDSNWTPRRPIDDFDSARINGSTSIVEFSGVAGQVNVYSSLLVGKDGSLAARVLGIGDATNTSGSVSVTGDNAFLFVRDLITLGKVANDGTVEGTGTLILTPDGSISVGRPILGGGIRVNPGSSLQITGAPATLGGTDVRLDLLGDGLVESGGMLQVLSIVFGDKGKLTVDAAKVFTGNIGGAGSTTVAHGGELTATSAASVIGKGSFQVDGFGAKASFGALRIGSSGAAGGTFSVVHGAISEVSGVDLVINDGGAIQVEDQGSLLLATTSRLQMVSHNDASELAIRNGAGLFVSSAELSNNANITVQGTNAAFVVTNDLQVGKERNDTPSSVTILQGAQVTSAEGFVGRGKPSPNGLFSSGNGAVRIDGAGSKWIVNGALTIGPAGGQPNRFGIFDQYGSLSVSDGGLLQAQVVYLGDPDPVSLLPATARNSVIAIGGATVAAAPGRLTIADDINIGRYGLVLFNHDATAYTFDTKVESIAFNNGVIEQRSGTTMLTGPLDRFTGDIEINGGQLFVNTDAGSTKTTVNSGGRLGGTGSVAGSVTVKSNGTLFGGQDNNPLTMSTLVLNSGANINVGIESLTPVPIFDVLGAITLDGVINITAPDLLAAGMYRIFNYGGGLTNNGLDIGLTSGILDPAAFAVFLTPGQVNLLYGGNGGVPMSGEPRSGNGNGTIQIGGGGWADGNSNPATLAAGDFLILSGPGMSIAVEDSGGAVDLGGLQFAAGGFALNGDPITTSQSLTPFRVGDGTGAGAAFTGTINAPITGEGGIEKTDLGTLILTGTNTYQGGTTISAGVLQVSGDGALGAAGSGVTLAGGTLRSSGPFTSARTISVDSAGSGLDTGANAWTLSGPLTGAGTLHRMGSGVLTYSGDGADFSGTLSLDAGRLNLSGTLGGTIVVGNGATISGTGSAGNLDLLGTIAPGNSPGTLTVDGDVTFSAGSTYQVELAASGAGDRIEASGAAILQGGTVVVTTLDPDFNYTDGAVYRILNAAGGRTGSFAGLTENSAFLDFALDYDATGVSLTVDVIRMFPDVAITSNQIQSSAALMQLDRTAGSDALGVYNAILLLDEGPARAAFDVASGEIYASLLASGQARGFAWASRLVSHAYETDIEGWRVWGGVTGQDGRTSTDGNGARFTADGFGGEVGADYHGGENGWAAGIAAGWLEGDLDLSARDSHAKTTSRNVGVYMRYGSGGTGFSAAATAAYAWDDADVTRSIAFGTIARDANADTGLTSSVFGAEARWGLGLAGAWAMGPLASLTSVRSRLDRFAEGGAGALNLSGGGDGERSTRYGIGAFLHHAGSSGSFDATFQYAGSDRVDGETSLIFAGSPQPFTIVAAHGSRDAFVANLSGEYALGGGWSLGGDLGAALAKGEHFLSGGAHIGVRF